MRICILMLYLTFDDYMTNYVLDDYHGYTTLSNLLSFTNLKISIRNYGVHRNTDLSMYSNYNDLSF